MKRIAWKYLAGLIDGEGCIDVQVTRQVYVRPRLRIAMADVGRELLTMCQANFGGHICQREFNNPEWSDPVSWEVSGYSTACSLLRNIVNHLILKREQARFCLWMERNLKGQRVSADVRDAVREELKLMKRDPHRLSEAAQDRIHKLDPVLAIRNCDAIVESVVTH